MSNRKPGVLPRFGPGRMPSRYVIVQGMVSRVFGGDADEVGRQELTRWGALRVDGWPDLDGPPGGASGDNAASWWDTLSLWTADAPDCLLVSWSAREQAAVLGLWDGLLDGTYRLWGYPGRGDDPSESQGGAPGRGTVILEGPPTVIRFRTVYGGDRACRVTWVDPANYGAACPGRPTDRPADAPAGAPPQDPWLRPDLAAQCAAAYTWLRDYVCTLGQLKLGGLEVTAAAQAASGYRRSYMRDPIVCHDNATVLKLERAAIHGGRCEVLYRGTVLSGAAPPRAAGVEPAPAAVLADAGPVYHLDVNSLYPSVARDALLPASLAVMARHVDPGQLLAVCKTSPCAARVNLDLRDPCVPFKVDARTLGRPKDMAGAVQNAGGLAEGCTIYPVGKFTAELCGPEILLAARHGRVLSCPLLAVYEGRPLFRSYVDTLYRQRLAWRQAGKPALAECAKALLNTLYGKFAQRWRRWVDVPDEVCPWPFYQWVRRDRDTGELDTWRSFAWAVQRQQDCGEPPDSCPIITAYVNSLGRVRLAGLLEAAGAGHVYYCDTDSLWCDGTALAALTAAGEIDPDRLGALKVVESYPAAEFWGVKRYRVSGRTVCCGDDPAAGACGDAFALVHRRPPVGTYLARRQAPGAHADLVRVRLTQPYTLRRCSPDGWTEPWRV